MVGDSGPVPMSEELPVDTTAQPFCLRALSERVRPLMCHAAARNHVHLTGSLAPPESVCSMLVVHLP